MNIEVRDKPALATGKLGFPALFAQAFGTMTPPYNMILVGAVVFTFAGRAAPAAFVIAGLGMLFYALTIIGMARNVRSAGGLYTAIQTGLGRKVGLWFAGALLANGVFSLPAALASAAYLMQLIFAGLAAHHPILLQTWLVWSLLLGGLTFAVVYLGADVSARVVLTLLGLGIACILAIDARILCSVGLMGISWGSLWPFGQGGGAQPMLLGIGVAVITMAGSEGAIFMSEEARKPDRDVPLAVIGSISCALAFYLLTSLAFVAALPGRDPGQVWAEGGPAVLLQIGTRYIGRTFAELTLILVALAAFAGVVSFVNYVARLVFALAREGHLPKICASANRFGAPAGASALLAVSTIFALAIGFALLGGSAGAALTFYSWLYVSVAIFLLFNSLLVCVAAWRIGRAQGSSIWARAVVPGVTFAVMLLAAKSQLTPLPPPPFDSAAWVAVLLLVVIVSTVEMGWRIKARRNRA